MTETNVTGCCSPRDFYDACDWVDKVFNVATRKDIKFVQEAKICKVLGLDGFCNSMTWLKKINGAFGIRMPRDMFPFARLSVR